MFLFYVDRINKMVYNERRKKSYKGGIYVGSNNAVLNIQETVARAKKEGMPITEYSLRRAIKSGSLPCRQIGRTYYIAWINFVNWITCADAAIPRADNDPGSRAYAP